MIDAKVEGQEVIAPPEVKKEPSVVNLMEALKSSLAQAKKVAVLAKPPRLAAPIAGRPRQVRRRKSS